MRALEGELDRSRREFWALLGEADWQSDDRAPTPPEDPVLKESWPDSPTTRVNRRRSLLLMAVGSDRLVVDPDAEVGQRVRAVSAQE